MDVHIAAEHLAVGMYVTGLDRPWIDTPFLLQGFIIDDDEMLQLVRKHCKRATVDKSASVAGLFASEDTGDRPANRRSAHLAPEPSISSESVEAKGAEDQLNLLSAVRDLFRRGDKNPGGKVKPIVTYRNTQSFPEELPAARVAHEVSSEAVETFLNHLREETLPEIDQIGDAVRLVVDSMVRNPSAMLYLSSLKEQGGYIYAHAIDTSIHMIAFGRQLGFPHVDLITLGEAGMSLDIGKMKLPKALINFRGTLPNHLRLQCQKHVAEGVAMLSSAKDFSESVVEIVARHHERFDGSGYPGGLAGEGIGLFPSMAGIVDTFTALTSERPYAKAISASEALRVLNQMRGTLFQSSLVDQFIQCVGIYPVGSLVELSTGDIAIVIDINRSRRMKPKVMLVAGPDKKQLAKPVDVDLAMNARMVGGEAVTVLRELPPSSFGLRLADFFL